MVELFQSGETSARDKIETGDKPLVPKRELAGYLSKAMDLLFVWRHGSVHTPSLRVSQIDSLPDAVICKSAIRTQGNR